MTTKSVSFFIDNTNEDVDDDYEEVFYDFPAKFEVCSRCKGHGTHLNPNIGGHAYTADEFNESFDDEDKEQYFKHGGIYDVTCFECKGNRVTLEIDESKFSDKDKEIFARYEEYQSKISDDRATERMERLMGC